MSGLFDTVGLKVPRDGVVEFSGRRFWSQASHAISGQWVLAKLPRQDQDRVVLITQSGEELCADLIDDAAFQLSELGRARAADFRRLREAQRASVVRWQAEALADLLDQHVEDALTHFPSPNPLP